MAGYILERDFTRPKKLIKFLINNNENWRGKRYNWVFRGHSDDNYKLIPSSLRDTQGRTTNREQIDYELRILQKFYWGSDAQGLYIPGDVNLLRTPKNWRKLKDEINNNGWPIDDFLPLLALAQHYRLATRLLDWSDKSLVAAFFAAKKADFDKYNGKIGIWALDLDWVINRAFAGRGKRENEIQKLPVYVVTAPRYSNPNLHAQGGVFTTEEIDSSNLDSTVTCRPVNEIVSEKYARMGENKHVMMHLTLPTHQAAELLRLLAQEGMSSSAIYPGFKGVAQSINEMKLWNDRKENMPYWLAGGFSLLK